MAVIGKMAKYDRRRRFYYLVLFGIVIVLIFYAMVETPGHHPYMIHFVEGSASKRIRDVLLRREIFLKVICEKVKFSIYEFNNNFRDYE